VKVRFEDRIQHQFQRRLDHPVGDRGDPEPTQLAARLGDHPLPHRQRPEAAVPQRGPQPVEEVLDPDPLHDGRRCRTVHPGGFRALVAPHPIPAHQQERWIGDEIEQIVKAAMRIITSPTVQLGLDTQYSMLGAHQRRARLVGIHQRPPLGTSGVPVSALLTCWPPSPCIRLSRTPAAGRHARDYYEASAPICGHQLARACPRLVLAGRDHERPHDRFPRSPSNRSAREVPTSTPAASPRLRRRPSPWPPHRWN